MPSVPAHVIRERNMHAARTLWHALPEPPIKIDTATLAARSGLPNSAVGFYARGLQLAGQLLKSEVNKHGAVRKLFYWKADNATLEGFLAVFDCLPQERPSTYTKSTLLRMRYEREDRDIDDQAGLNKVQYEAEKAAEAWARGFLAEGRHWGVSTLKPTQGVTT